MASTKKAKVELLKNSKKISTIKMIVVRDNPRDSLSEHEKQVLDLVSSHVSETSSAFEIPEALLSIAKSLVKKGLLFWSSDYLHVMNYRNVHE